MPNSNFQQRPSLGQSYQLAHLYQQEASFILVVTPDMQTASRLASEVNFFLTGNVDIQIFPDWEILPYDSFSPHQDIISQRLLTLYRLPKTQHGITFIPINTLMQRLAPPSFLEHHSFVLAKSDQLDPQALSQRLGKSGYHHVSQVMEHGEFSIRGSVIDLYPMGSDLPFRIDLFDNEVESIRTFDPETQLSIEKINDIQLLPACEFPFSDESIILFRQQWRERFPGNPAECPVYQNVSHGESAAGIEYYLPLFFEQTATFFDYLPKNTLCVMLPDSHDMGEQFWSEVNERYEQLRHDVQRPLLPPQDVLLPVNECFKLIKEFPTHQARETEQHLASIPACHINYKAKQPLYSLLQYLENTHGRTLFCAESTGRREVLIELLHTINIKPLVFESWPEFLRADDKYGITVAPLDQGLSLTDKNINIISEFELFGEKIRQQRKSTTRVQDPEAIIRDLTELKIGAPVVHIEHGIGRYQGLEKITTGDVTAEYLKLIYANNDKLFVPVSSLHLISRYTGSDSDNIYPHRLGSGQWEKAKQKAAKRARDAAVELLDIYAKREAKTGYTFKLPEKDYSTFAQQFPFQETEDQQRAIEDVINDLTSSKSMDRLVCGDVGFGKTEVAMRAAFIVALNGKQVAMLVPTTLLCEQHGKNFQDRFADWPIKIASLSRFRSAKEQNTILEGLTNGKIDIVISTHKLLSADIKFKDLGLLIIDEEHRFGVRQKDRIKALRAEVDILALTATPIPRTLNMSLSGIRDLSIIATPPQRRLSILTFVRPYQPTLIREAILRETLRGGQVYFMHNEVKSIEAKAEEISKLVPEARITIAHGQMRERDLENIMTDFYHQRFNVLVCTTIIESGIDIPTANTIIINRADKLGLAQLHQIRGRVGRSHHQAYAYLMTPEENAMTRDAKKRLEAISSFEDLGAGFILATNDLEIRGAGELLGEEQSGHIAEVGFSLYMDLIDTAVKALKSGKEPILDAPLSIGPEIDLPITALIPEDYVYDVHLRLTLYKRISNAANKDQLKDLQIEFIDRFGLLPEATKQLFNITELKLLATSIGITKITSNYKDGRIDFNEEPNINVAKLLELIQTQSEKYRFIDKQRLRFQVQNENPLATVQQLINNIIDA